MFEDMGVPGERFQFHDRLSDREILHALWFADGIEDLAIDDGWMLLHERYPDDPRFLLAYFAVAIQKDLPSDAVMRILGKLVHSTVPREPLTWIGSIVFNNADDWYQGSSARRWKELTEGIRDVDYDVAVEKIAAWSRTFLEELHERTLGGKPLGERKTARTKSKPSPPTIEAARALGRTARPYSAKSVFQVGDIVAHPRFGEGVVRDKVEGKIDVEFASGTKRLLSA